MKRPSQSGAVLMLMILILGACQTVSQPRPDSPAAAPEEKSAATPDFRELNDLGVHFLRQGVYDEAFIQFQKALVLNPEYARAHFNLALVYYRKGLYDREIEEYREAIRMEPDYFNAHLNLAHAYLAMGKTADAAGEYRWVLKKEPHQRKALYNLAVILTDQKKTAEASALFKRYLKLEPKGPWAGRANQYLQEGLKGGKP